MRQGILFDSIITFIQQNLVILMSTLTGIDIYLVRNILTNFKNQPSRVYLLNNITNITLNIDHVLSIQTSLFQNTIVSQSNVNNIK